MPGHLSFIRPLVQPILDGRKTQTLRARVPHTVVCAEEIIAWCSHSQPPFARLHVVSIDRVHVTDLDHHDARREAAPSLSHLLDALGSIYPDASHLIRVQFSLL